MGKFEDAMTGVAAGAIGDVASLVTGGIAGGMSARKAEKLAKAQYARQLDFWNKQNEYNLPINQKKRLQDAGLSVGLMYSQGGNITNAGELSSVPGDPSAGRVSVHSGFMENMLAVHRMEAEIDEIHSRENLNNAQAEAVSGKLPYEIDSMESQRRLNLIYGDNAKLEGTALGLDIAYKKAMNPISIEQAKQNFNQGVYLLERYAWEADKAMTDARFARGTYDTRKQMQEADLAERLAQVAVMGVQMEAMKKGIELTEAQIRDFRSKLLGNYGDSAISYVKGRNALEFGVIDGSLPSLAGSVLGHFSNRLYGGWKDLFGSSAPKSVTNPIDYLLKQIEESY